MGHRILKATNFPARVTGGVFIDLNRMLKLNPPRCFNDQCENISTQLE